MYEMFLNAAEFCEHAYGIYNDAEEGFFVCPNCEEVIYFEDWNCAQTENWMCCPICECSFGMVDEEEDDE